MENQWWKIHQRQPQASQKNSPACYLQGEAEAGPDALGCNVTKHTWAFFSTHFSSLRCHVAGPAQGSHELMASPGYSTPPLGLCSPLSSAGSSGTSKGSQRFFKQPGEVSWDSKAPHPLLRAGFGSQLGGRKTCWPGLRVAHRESKQAFPAFL